MSDAFSFLRLTTVRITGYGTIWANLGESGHIPASIYRVSLAGILGSPLDIEGVFEKILGTVNIHGTSRDGVLAETLKKLNSGEFSNSNLE